MRRCPSLSTPDPAYPELYAIIGGQVPNFHDGSFLRGVGGNADGIGQVQQDAGRNVSGELKTFDHPATEFIDWGEASGALSLFSSNKYDISNVLNSAQLRPSGFSLDASRQWGTAHTASEFRPYNRAVRYLIRALP